MEIKNLTIEVINTLEKNCLIIKKKEDSYFESSNNESACNTSVNEYEKRIICENKIKGLLTAERVIEDGLESFHYDISSLQNLKKMAKIKEFGYPEIRAIVESISKLKNRLVEYLLDADNVIFYPEYVFYDRSRREIMYCFHPGYNCDICESLMRFAEYIMQYTDHSDENAMELVYGFYKKICEEDFYFEDLLMVQIKDNIQSNQIDNESKKSLDENECEKDLEDEPYIKKDNRLTALITVLLMIVLVIIAVVVCLVGM